MTESTAKSPGSEPRTASGLTTSPHAVVLGAGFGGLAAAVRLLARGFRVTVVDRLDQAGGRARVFKEDGHVFDAGPTVITAPFLFEDLWKLAGKKIEDDVEMKPVSPFYRIRFDDGHVFDYTGDPAAMRKEVARLSIGDVPGYERFVRASEEIFNVGFEQLAHVPFDDPQAMLRIVPKMMRLESYRTVYGLVSKYVKHPKLRQVLSFHPLLLGGSPFSTTSIYTLIAFLERRWGVHFAMGGTGALVNGLVGLVEQMGGELRLGTEVNQILVQPADGSSRGGLLNGLLKGRSAPGKRRGRAAGVQLNNGERIHADLVVSNADSAFTYRHLIPETYRTRWTNDALDKARYSMGLFVWYFGTDKRYEEVAHHTILLGPRYKGLLEDIFDRKVLARDFSLYLHRPTATDPSMAPEGRDTFYVLSPVPHLVDPSAPGYVDWEKQAEPYRQRIEKYLSDTVLPGLGDHLTASRTLSPHQFRSDYLSLQGAGFGLEPVLLQSAYFRPHNKSEELEHLYLVGAGTHPGGGMPGVLSSARVLDSVIPDPRTFPIRSDAEKSAPQFARS